LMMMGEQWEIWLDNGITWQTSIATDALLQFCPPPLPEIWFSLPFHSCHNWDASVDNSLRGWGKYGTVSEHHGTEFAWWVRCTKTRQYSYQVYHIKEYEMGVRHIIHRSDSRSLRNFSPKKWREQII
jgi:hypothetical protein